MELPARALIWVDKMQGRIHEHEKVVLSDENYSGGESKSMMVW
jgi:hypothetical protein